jgi:hypothetical protein
VWSKAKPFNLSLDMVLLRYVLRRLKADTDLSLWHDVTGAVIANISKVRMLGNRSASALSNALLKVVVEEVLL